MGCCCHAWLNVRERHGPRRRRLIAVAAALLLVLVTAAPAAADTIRISADPTKLHVIDTVDVAEGEAIHVQARLEATDA